MPLNLFFYNSSQSQQRNFGLDLLRVVAIGLVFYAHAVSGVVKGVLIGDLGVELFFVLSGFLVGRYFFVSDREFDVNFALRFMSKRWLRTLPLYYAVILLKMLLTRQSFAEAWTYFAFIQNYVSLSFFPVSWSLSIEEWFYLLLPVMALTIIKNSGHANRIILCIVAVYGISLLLRAYGVSNHVSWEAMMSSIHLRMDSLLTGVALVFIKYQRPASYEKLRSGWVFCFALLALGLYLYAFADAYLASDLNTVVFFRVFGFMLLSIALALLFPFVESVSVEKETLMGRLLSRVIIAGSMLTYAFYLVHSEVIDYFSTLQLGCMEKIIGAFLVSVILAWVLYLCIERPFLKIKNTIKISGT